MLLPTARMSGSPLPAVVEPLLDYLSDVLPSPVYGIVETLLTHLWTLAVSLFQLGVSLITSSPSTWDAEKILPPLITLLITYLALLSFYRTTGWMIRTAFAFMKWGVILSALGAAAGYFLANGEGRGNALGALGAGSLGIVQMAAGYLFGVLNGERDEKGTNGQSRKSTSSNNSRGTRNQRVKGQSQSSSYSSSSRPKAWDSWDRYQDWQSKVGGQDGKDAAAEMQKTIGEMLGSASKAVKDSAWWEAAKGVVNDFAAQGQSGRGADNGRGTKKTTSKSR